MDNVVVVLRPEIMILILILNPDYDDHHPDLPMINDDGCIFNGHCLQEYSKKLFVH